MKKKNVSLKRLNSGVTYLEEVQDIYSPLEPAGQPDTLPSPSWKQDDGPRLGALQTGEYHNVWRVRGYSLEEVGEVSLAAAGPRHLHSVCLENGRHDVQRGAHAPVAADLLRVVVHAETAQKQNHTISNNINEMNIFFFGYGSNLDFGLSF